MQINSVFPIKQVRGLNLLYGALESPLEYPHMSRRTLMSPLECEIALCSPNQLEIMRHYIALAPEQLPVPHVQGKWLDFLWATTQTP